MSDEIKQAYQRGYQKGVEAGREIPLAGIDPKDIETILLVSYCESEGGKLDDGGSWWEKAARDILSHIRNGGQP